ncbi:MAG: oligosaccharide flippase family protein [Planctomycetes bacterium]|nr:oligosaccharide flippase family protein [Planctomycetota bacterium]
MSVYLPSMVLQKGLGLGRVILLTWLVSKTEMGFWGLAVMAFTVAAPLVTLGANHALSRYVSVYEARGQLLEFYRRVRTWVIWLAVVLTGLALALSPWLVRALLVFKQAVRGGPVTLNPYQWYMALVTIGTVGAMGLYLCMLSFAYGLRVYRLTSVVEIVYSVVFTALAIVWASATPGALSILLAHLVSLGATLALGGVLLDIGVRRLARNGTGEREAAPLEDDVEPVADADDVGMAIPIHATEPNPPAEPVAAGLKRFVRFGMMTMLGAMIWQATGFVSYFMVYVWFDGRTAGPLAVFLRLSQPVAFIAGAAWAILFTHVARRWEDGDRDGAMFVLETAYKALSLAVMTFSVLLYVTAPWWRQIVDPAYRYGYLYLPGLLTFSVAVSNMTLLTILAKLHERPGIIAIAGLAACSLNVLLAAMWMSPPYSWHVNGAARAAGVGMYFGGGLVLLVYLLAARVRLSDSTYFILATPVLLMLPALWVGVAWPLILAVCLLTGWVFDRHEREVLGRSMHRLGAAMGRLVPWR